VVVHQTFTETKRGNHDTPLTTAMPKWTNGDTEAVAEFISKEDREWNESKKHGTPFWRGTADEILDTNESPDAPVSRLTEMLRYLFCGEAEEPVQTEKTAGITLSRVDWKQIAEWLLEKSRQARSSTGES
jgi:hypothetical protein